MDEVYRSVLDPLTALAYAAAGTSRIRLGVAVINPPVVSPAYLAKQAATGGVLSGGRLDLGPGIGWMPEGFAAPRAAQARRRPPTAANATRRRTLWAGGGWRRGGSAGFATA